MCQSWGQSDTKPEKAPCVPAAGILTAAGLSGEAVDCPLPPTWEVLGSSFHLNFCNMGRMIALMLSDGCPYVRDV